VIGQPTQPVGGRRQVEDREPQRVTVERTTQHQCVAELLGHVVGDALVGGGGGGEHRCAGGKIGEEGAQAAVVGPEVVPPVGDAVRLVDDQETGGRGQPGQDGVPEVGVVEPLGADQQHVDGAVGHRRGDLVPLVEVGGVDRARVDAGAGGRLDLVAHERE
jgi:hypothetical protein